MGAVGTLCSPEDDDGDALNRLFARYYERVQRIVRLRLGSALRGRVESSDSLLKAFLAAARSLDSFEGTEEASLVQWLSRLVERQIRDEADGLSAGSGGEALVAACLPRLPEKDRELILLRDYAGASWEAIAEETGLASAAAARMAHARALVELRKRLRDRRKDSGG